MKFFVDTGDTAEIRDLEATGMLDGVTTNPSLIMKAGKPFIPLIEEICSIVKGPVSAEVASTDYETMLKEGQKLRILMAASAPGKRLQPVLDRCVSLADSDNIQRCRCRKGICLGNDPLVHYHKRCAQCLTA